jgi:translation initiation factor 3 subunit M
MSAIVNLSTTEENAVKLAQFLAENAPNVAAKAVAEQCSALGEQSQFSEFVAKLTQQPDLLFASEKDSEVEGVFGWLGSLLVLPSADHESLVMNLCAAVVQDTARAPLRLKVLASLFNLLSHSPVRFKVFTLLLNFADKTNQVNSISSYLLNIDVHVKSWNSATTTEDLRQLYLLTYTSLSSSEKKFSTKSLLKYLATFNGASASDLATVKEHAAKAVIDTIEAPLELSRFAPGSDQSSIMTYSAVLNLKDDAKYGSLFSLLQVFSNGNVVEFQNSKVEGVDLEKGLNNVRLLSICGLASSARELKYSDIASALEIDETAVEQWVVRAVTAELLEAQIDQLRRVIIVERAAPRFFNDQHWQDLNVKLHGWRDSVKELLAVVRSAKENRAVLQEKRAKKA